MPALSRISKILKSSEVLFVGILLLGVFARTWEFGKIPPGLNADEASIGVEASNLYHYGVDRNGISFPIHFISWGSGQNALYGYLLIPFIAIFGLSPAVVRLPMLLTGILSLPLLYFAAKETFGAHFGLLSMFYLAVSPWHILMSRWGLESNLFPFVFLAGYACLLRTERNGNWLVPAGLIFGLSLYAYGTSYAMVPVFMICAVLVLIRTRSMHKRHLIGGIVAFILIALPIGLFVMVNTFGMGSIRIGPVTIPRLPVLARYETETAIFSGNPARAMLENLWTMSKLLATQSDGIIYNIADPYGYFYTITFPFALLGGALLVRNIRAEKRPGYALLLCWLGASLLIGMLQPANVNRLNIIFIPILLCIAECTMWASTYSRLVLPVCVCLLLTAFLAFTVRYHGESYRAQANWKFNAGLLPALQFARQISDAPICMTNSINMPYIFALFSEQTSPSAFLSSVKYADAETPLRQVLSFGRYRFGRKNCTTTQMPTYLFIAGETPPHLGNRYEYQFFDKFVIYYAKP